MEQMKTGKWVTAWAMAHTSARVFGLKLGSRTSCARISCPIAGNALRVTLSNRYGLEPLTVERGAIYVAGEGKPLLFSGSRAVSLGPGESRVSDGAALSVSAGETVEIRLFYGDGAVAASGNALLRGMHSPTGDYTASVWFPMSDEDIWAVPVRPFPLPEPIMTLAALDVFSESGRAVAVLGDSNAFNGFYTGPLGKLLSERNTALLNLGISGNRLRLDSGMAHTGGIFGEAALKRVDWDVLSYSGIDTVIVNVGGNDIFQPGTFAAPLAELCTAMELWDATEALLQKIHAAGCRGLLCTVTPCGGADGFTAEKEKILMQFNRLARGCGCADGILDLNALLADPDHPDVLRTAFDSGDHLHFNAAAGAYLADRIAALL